MKKWEYHLSQKNAFLIAYDLLHGELFFEDLTDDVYQELILSSDEQRKKWIEENLGGGKRYE